MLFSVILNVITIIWITEIGSSNKKAERCMLNETELFPSLEVFPFRSGLRYMDGLV